MASPRSCLWRPALAVLAWALLSPGAAPGVSGRGTSAPLLSTRINDPKPEKSVKDGPEFWHKLAPEWPQLIRYGDFPCQNSSYTLADLTVVVYSAVAVAEERLPAIRDTWLQHVSDAGARVVAFTGHPAPWIPGLEVAVASAIEVGPTGCDTGERGHCQAMLLDQLAWLKQHVRTRLVLRVDDDTLVNATSLAATLRCMPERGRWLVGDCQFEVGACSPAAR